MPNSSQQIDAKEPQSSQEARADGTQFAELWRPDDDNSKFRGPERVLIDAGKVTPEQVEQANETREQCPHLSLLEVLIVSKAIDETQAQQAVAEYFKLPFLHITAEDVDPATFELLPLDYIKTKNVMPIRREEEGGIVVGLSDPADMFLIDDVKRRLREPVKLVVTMCEEMRQVLDEIAASSDQQVEEIIQDITEDSVEVVTQKHVDDNDLEKSAGESPVIRYVNFLITSAVRDGASDIHIEPSEKRLRVRCRIDGLLFDQQAPPMGMHAAIVSRLKIMANLDISERRLPQDGRIRATVRGRTVDLRVSTLPVIHGEKCVIRILDTRSILVGLENLGMLPDTLELFRRQILQPHGIVLVTGPTGSGKSTTLYSALQIMKADEMNISTVEDPVEYELASINQVHVHDSIGMTFSAALRSLLRQDPDVVMIGEIRDVETARIAVQASLTGHLVLSTLHTNDAPSSISRLMNIGVEPYLISASVNAILAQRLVRRICENCKTPVANPREADIGYLRKHGDDNTETIYQGAGCEKCRHTGYKGRVGLYELMIMDEEIRRVISSDVPLAELRRLAREGGMVTLCEDGIKKVADGQTTVEELMRVTEV